jgi:hypothetical protein
MPRTPWKMWADRELTVRQIAERLGMPKKQIAYHARRLGLPFPRRMLYFPPSHPMHAPYVWLPERNETLKRLWMRGISAKEIARQLDSTPPRICQQRIKLDLKSRIIHRSPRIKGRLPSGRLPKYGPHRKPPSLKTQVPAQT